VSTLSVLIAVALWGPGPTLHDHSWPVLTIGRAYSATRRYLDPGRAQIGPCRLVAVDRAQCQASWSTTDVTFNNQPSLEVVTVHVWRRRTAVVCSLAPDFFPWRRC
jgi:hypothetical protein